MRERQEQYPQLEVDLGKLQENLAALRERCQVSGIKLSGIVKGFCALPEAAKVYDRAGLDSIGSSRLEQLRTLRQAGIRTPLMMIRIPMRTEVDELVEWADISLQSEISVLRATNEAAARAGVRHKVILMVDLGDLREGFWDREELISAALEVEQKLENLDLWAATAPSRPPPRRWRSSSPPPRRWRRPSAAGWRSSPAGPPPRCTWCWTAPCPAASTTCGWGSCSCWAGCGAATCRSSTRTCSPSGPR